MQWYLTKIIYQIICKGELHLPQFDEQLRIICAEDDLHAFQKARLLGEKEEDCFLNKGEKPVLWKFIDVSEIHPLNELLDGAEMYSRIKEEDDAETFIHVTKLRASHLLENCTHQSIRLN